MPCAPSGTPQSAEHDLDAEALAGANGALVGDEIIGFRDAVLIAPGSYRLSGLLRGRLGTDAPIATHGPGERFVLLSGALGLERIRDALGLRGISRSYKAVSLWQEETAVAAASFANTARGLAPLSPMRPQAPRPPLRPTALAVAQRLARRHARLEQ